ncbi:hypothetical protein CMI41_00680 [Candidatus Pacearchaeota archaeon]|nr:hypothetical protein [Candidatus Pacearchaeota archaeon]|tara:strand:- start:479 stop:1834 length:1356 start_codon:yes stop_codon:yes gene_type:complete
MKKISFLFLGLILLSLASTLEISEELNTNVIVKEFNTPIEMTLTATNASSGSYNLYTLAEIVIAPAEVFQHSGGTLEKTFYLTENSRLDVEGYYVFTYTLNHRDVEQVDKKLTLNLLSIADVLDISTEVITLNDTEATIVVKNLEDVSLTDIKVEFSSVLFTHEETFSLAPEGETTITTQIDAEKLMKTKAGTYIIDSKVSTPEGEVTAQGKLYLNEQREVRSEESTSGILIRTTTVNKLNVGNAVEDIEVVIKKNIISRLFTSFNVEPSSSEREGTKIYFTWSDRLYPNNSLKIEAKTNWAIPFLIILAIVLAYFGIMRVIQKKLEIKKSVSLMKTKGGDFALKVKLNLKARKDVENVSLVDRIPAIVKLYNKFGTIKPSKIDAHNRKIQWVVGDLRAGEERVFSYIVYSKVGVMGKFSLPSAKAIFEAGNNIEETNSNKVFFLSSQTNK